VWCWGWDGAGDLKGLDVDPIWEHMGNKSIKPEYVLIRQYQHIHHLSNSLRQCGGFLFSGSLYLAPVSSCIALITGSPSFTPILHRIICGFYLNNKYTYAGCISRNIIVQERSLHG